MARKCAFVSLGEWSGTNRSLLAAIREHFAEFDVERIDVLNEMVKRRGFLAMNVVQTVREHGVKILLRGWRPGFCFYRTTYFFREISRQIRQRLESGAYDFSFQTTSIFDGSAPGVPNFVFTDHTHLARLYFPEVPADQLSFVKWMRLEPTIYRNAAGLFSFSTHISRSLTEQYSIDTEKITCVGAGSNAPPGADVDPDRFERKTILFVGRDWKRKGGPMLAQAFERVRRAHPKARLVIVGCSPRLRLDGCEVVGSVPRDRVHKYFSRASVFCLPTRLEPFGIVFLEAMEMGLPIVGTKIGAIPDFLVDGANGYAVEPDDVERLAEVLIELLGDPEKCRRFGERGRQLAEERFNWDVVGERVRERVGRTVILGPQNVSGLNQQESRGGAGNNTRPDRSRIPGDLS